MSFNMLYNAIGFLGFSANGQMCHYRNFINLSELYMAELLKPKQSVTL